MVKVKFSRSCQGRRLELEPLARVLHHDLVDDVIADAASAHLGQDVEQDVRVAVTAVLHLQQQPL